MEGLRVQPAEVISDHVACRLNPRLKSIESGAFAHASDDVEDDRVLSGYGDLYELAAVDLNAR